jgi:hypothetical protein
LAPGALATGLAATLGGGALTGWVFAASGFAVAAGFAALLVTAFTGSTFFESFPDAAFAG